jgi:hypothetical protein
MKTDFTLPLLPPPPEIETREILKQLTLSHRHLAELKGVVKTIPNEQILINTLSPSKRKSITWKKNAIFCHVNCNVAKKRLFLPYHIAH